MSKKQREKKLKAVKAKTWLSCLAGPSAGERPAKKHAEVEHLREESNFAGIAEEDR